MSEIQQHLARHRVSETRFGREAMGDPRLLSDMRRGRELRAATCRRIREFMAARNREAAGSSTPSPAIAGGAGTGR